MLQGGVFADLGETSDVSQGLLLYNNTFVGCDFLIGGYKNRVLQ